jgi:hypothetical protein
MLCMRSKTKKADKIREYYLELEKLILKTTNKAYRIDIIGNLCRYEAYTKLLIMYIN